jgi:hypothetical protein
VSGWRPPLAVYLGWLAVGVPLGLWMVIGRSDVAAILFVVNALAYGAVWEYLKRRARRAP